MKYVVTLVHTPELCLAREEFAGEAKRWIAGMDDLAERLGVRVLGAYSCPPEHTFYVILETDDFKNVPAFFSGIMLSNHTARVSPVISLREASDMLIK
jgi:hypothetical protein